MLCVLVKSVELLTTERTLKDRHGQHKIAVADRLDCRVTGNNDKQLRASARLMTELKQSPVATSSTHYTNARV